MDMLQQNKYHSKFIALSSITAATANNPLMPVKMHTNKTKEKASHIVFTS